MKKRDNNIKLEIKSSSTTHHADAEMTAGHPQTFRDRVLNLLSIFFFFTEYQRDSH